MSDDACVRSTKISVSYKVSDITGLGSSRVGENGGAPPFGEHRPPKYNKKQLYFG